MRRAPDAGAACAAICAHESNLSPYLCAFEHTIQDFSYTFVKKRAFRRDFLPKINTFSEYMSRHVKNEAICNISQEIVTGFVTI